MPNGRGLLWWEKSEKLNPAFKYGQNRRKKMTKEYKAWSNMHTRCYDPNHDRFKNYGGRGIVVCDRRLNSFENFFADIGPAPGPEYSIDRINNNGNYEPGNIKWSTGVEQANNRRRRVP